MEPNMREKASFLKENFVPLKDHQLLNFIDVCENVSFNDVIDMQFVYGHTEAMMIPEIKLDNGEKLIYMADLLPSSGHVRLPYIMSYDIRPLVTLAEKEKYYSKYANDKTIVMFEHDKDFAFGRIRKDERGRFAIETLDLSEVM
jgi:glyoxylase-like metal-dependent hydrolase (beta-lactamase superfamily II)